MTPHRKRPAFIDWSAEPNSSRLYDPSSSFHTDVVIRQLDRKEKGVRLLDRWKARLCHAIELGRRSVEVASLVARMADDKVTELNNALEDWQRTRAAVGKASAALDAFMANVSAGKSLHKGPAPMYRHGNCSFGKGTVGERSLFPTLNQMGRLIDPAASERELLDDTASRAEALVLSQYLLRRIDVEMGKKRRALSASKKNEGEAAKAAFVGALGEAWVALTGRYPGTSDGRHNPFLDFICAAWDDAGGSTTKTNFVRAMRSARDQAATRYPSLDFPTEPVWLMPFLWPAEPTSTHLPAVK